MAGDGKDLRIVVVGGKQVGKTALTVRYLTRRYITEYAHEKDTSYTHCTNIDGREVRMQILDSSGKNNAVLSWADGLIVVYSITSKKSFKKALLLIDELKKINMRSATIALIGNKADMKHNRQILCSEGEREAKQRECLFCEVSAARDIQAVQDVFDGLYSVIIAKRDGRSKAQQTSMLVRKFFRALSSPSSSPTPRDRSETV